MQFLTTSLVCGSNLGLSGAEMMGGWNYFIKAGNHSIIGTRE